MKRNLKLRSLLSFFTVAASAVLLTPHLALGEQVTYEASLSGSQVSGDPDGEGQATVTMDLETKEIEVDLRYSDIAEPTAVHIRKGATGTEGGVLATFIVESVGQGMLHARGGARTDAFDAMLASPEDYYLVVFNEEHVVGALRGPLSE